MKLRIVLSNGQEREVIGIVDVEAWLKSFVGRGTSQLGDWLEVAQARPAGAPSSAPRTWWRSR